MQTNSNSKILQNGHLSDNINLGRGCRQGDPISPYLFVLAAEFLAEAIRTNTNIEGLTLHQKEHKLSQYADDTTLFIKYKEKCIRSCMETLWEFQLISGLKVNTEKTKVIQIGVLRDNRMRLCEDLNLIWSQKFTSLGIYYDIENMDNITDQNIENKMKEINKLIITWSGRNITPLGKIAIIKSLLISKFTHILLSLPTPSEDTITSLDNIFKNFIWKNKPPKFRREILEATHRDGGLKMTNLKTFDTALKVSWLKRLKNEEDGWEEFPRKINIHKIILFGDQYHTQILKYTKNNFWRDVINASKMLLEKLSNIKTDASNIPL